jgi:DNA-binding HxlR family transcriptional regulator
VRRKSFSEMNCSVAQSLEVVGEWWTVSIACAGFLGITRFDDFHQRLGISRNILTDRLDHLVTRGVLDHVPYQQHPVRYDYRLTDKGRDLWLTLTAMRQWVDRREADDGPPVVIEHRACGRATTVIPTCSSCGERFGAWSVRALSGPGAAKRPAVARLPPARRVWAR